MLLISNVARKSGLDIKKKILELLKTKEHSLKQLERKVNTNYNTIKSHCQELEYLKIIEIEEYSENKFNGRPYLVARLTNSGKKI